MTNSPNWVSVSLQLGYPQPGQVDSGKFAADGTTVLGPSIPVGTIGQFRDNGTTRLGMGTFIFLPGVTSTVAGDVVNYRTANGGSTENDINYGAATAPWSGTANTGVPLAVATAAVNLQTKWGWYQIQGGAIVNVSGTVAASDTKVYFGQTAVLQTNAAAGGKQVLGIQAASANSVPESGKAIFTLNSPVVQSQIT